MPQQNTKIRLPEEPHHDTARGGKIPTFLFWMVGCCCLIIISLKKMETDIEKNRKRETKIEKRDKK